MMGISILYFSNSNSFKTIGCAILTGMLQICPKNTLVTGQMGVDPNKSQNF
jgi:hypothetical protein